MIAEAGASRNSSSIKSDYRRVDSDSDTSDQQVAAVHVGGYSFPTAPNSQSGTRQAHTAHNSSSKIIRITSDGVDEVEADDNISDRNSYSETSSDPLTAVSINSIKLNGVDMAGSNYVDASSATRQNSRNMSSVYSKLQMANDHEEAIQLDSRLNMPASSTLNASYVESPPAYTFSSPVSSHQSTPQVHYSSSASPPSLASAPSSATVTSSSMIKTNEQFIQELLAENIRLQNEKHNLTQANEALQKQLNEKADRVYMQELLTQNIKYQEEIRNLQIILNEALSAASNSSSSSSGANTATSNNSSAHNNNDNNATNTNTNTNTNNTNNNTATTNNNDSRMQYYPNLQHQQPPLQPYQLYQQQQQQQHRYVDPQVTASHSYHVQLQQQQQQQQQQRPYPGFAPSVSSSNNYTVTRENLPASIAPAPVQLQSSAAGFSTFSDPITRFQSTPQYGGSASAPYIPPPQSTLSTTYNTTLDNSPSNSAPVSVQTTTNTNPSPSSPIFNMNVNCGQCRKWFIGNVMTESAMVVCPHCKAINNCTNIKKDILAKQKDFGKDKEINDKGDENCIIS